MTTRRDFVAQVGASALVASGVRDFLPSRQASPRGFLDILRIPDRVLVQTTTGDVVPRHSGNGRWNSDNGIIVATSERKTSLTVSLTSPAVAVRRIHLRWRGRMTDTHLTLGDAWERAYGDLEWRAFAPDRAMPWYFATCDGSLTHVYGVRTSPRAFCFWQMDEHGVSLWADVRSGSAGVQLGERTLDVCDVMSRAGHANESSFTAVHSFCRQMCPAPRMPNHPVYGSNDWYWVYGKNSAETVRVDARNIVELSGGATNKPYAVIDDGWQPGRGKEKTGVGTWDHGNDKFGDMAALAAEMRAIGARPGVWVRPLQATADAPDSWRLPRDRNVFDPTIPDVQQKIAADIRRLHDWGFELIKHDYTTFELFGRWGFQMGTALTRDGWTFASGSTRTNAEIIDDLYGGIRNAAGDSYIIGCNTVSHLSAGHFEMCRVGDDTSGTEWARTRKMGVNTLAFRGVQHGAFYVADADCVGVTNAVPWSLNRQWLDLLSRSGTMLFVSLAPDALGAEQRRDLRGALALASVSQPLAEPLDWQRTVYPERWRLMSRERTYDWVGDDGAAPP